MAGNNVSYWVENQRYDLNKLEKQMIPDKMNRKDIKPLRKG